VKLLLSRRVTGRRYLSRRTERVYYKESPRSILARMVSVKPSEKFDILFELFNFFLAKILAAIKNTNRFNGQGRNSQKGGPDFLNGGQNDRKGQEQKN